MSKNIVIAVDGTSTTIQNVEKLVTDLPGGGTCDWIPSDEAGTGSTFLYSLGSYYGSTEGEGIASLSCALSGPVGCKALLIVMHRDSISVPGMTLIDSTKVPNFDQWISVYSKVMTSASETVTITQATASRMCACSIYVNAETTLSGPALQAFDTGASDFQYTIAASNKPRLAVINHASAGNSYTTITPPHTALPADLTGTSQTVRMAAFIVQDVTSVVYSNQTAADSSATANNRLYLYEIN